MSIKELKKYLVQNNLAIQQWELTIISLIKKQEKLFQVTSEEIFGHIKSKNDFDRKFKGKVKAFSKSVSELGEFTKYIQDIDNISNEELERRSEKMIDSFENSKDFWTDDDRDEFTSIYSNYLQLKKKITITNKISNFFLKYEITKSIIQLIIFSFSFVISYYIGKTLEPQLSYFNDISRQFFIALVIFLTLEKLLDKFEDYLLYWRVNNLFEYFRVIMPLMEKFKSQTSGNTR